MCEQCQGKGQDWLPHSRPDSKCKVLVSTVNWTDSTLLLTKDSPITQTVPHSLHTIWLHALHILPHNTSHMTSHTSHITSHSSHTPHTTSHMTSHFSQYATLQVPSYKGSLLIMCIEQLLTCTLDSMIQHVRAYSELKLVFKEHSFVDKVMGVEIL